MNLADSFRAARWIRIINLLLQAVLFLSLFAGLNIIAQNHTSRFDLTQARKHSLSVETKSYLEHLERDVHITVTLTDDSDSEELRQAFRDVSRLLREYVYFTRNSRKAKVEVRHLNVYKNRKDAEALQIDQPDAVVIRCGDRSRVLYVQDLYTIKNKVRRESFQGEAALTAAILDVANAERAKIYFLTGHQELRPDNVDPTSGLSQLAVELRQRNFDVRSLDLSLTHKIPEDANGGVIIIAAPRQVKPFEEELLRKFLQTRAGRIILMLEPGRKHGLDNLLFEWDVVVYDKLVLDPDPQSLTETNDLRLWNFPRDAESHITDNLRNNDLFPVVGLTLAVSDDLGRSADDGLSVRKLITTSEAAWGESNYRQRVPAEYTPGQDLKGKLGVMVISERLKPANLTLGVRGGRLAVFGTADLVTNNRIFNQGNLNLFLATVNWSVDRDAQLNIPARPIQRFQLALSQEELTQLRLGLLFVVPGVVGLLGLLVYWTRRN